jgi:uncharacterized protein (DUF302 family)
LNGTSLHILDSEKTVSQLSAAFEAAVKAHDFGVLHTYDLKEMLTAKRFPLRSACRMYEICNPRLASEVLALDITLNMALPCRVSIYEDGGATRIGMIKPTSLLAIISTSPALWSAAHSVEQAVMQMMEDAARV